jgi:hypothetical protein
MYFSYFEGFNEHSTNKKPICLKRRVPQSSERNNGLEAIKPIQLQSEPWLQLLLLHTDNLRSETVRLILLHLSSAGAASTAATITLLLHLWHGARHELQTTTKRAKLNITTHEIMPSWDSFLFLRYVKACGRDAKLIPY